MILKIIKHHHIVEFCYKLGNLNPQVSNLNKNRIRKFRNYYDFGEDMVSVISNSTGPTLAFLMSGENMTNKINPIIIR